MCPFKYFNVYPYSGVRQRDCLLPIKFNLASKYIIRKVKEFEVINLLGGINNYLCR